MKKYAIILFSIGLLAGVLIGRMTIATETKVEYVKGETIAGSTPAGQLVPTKETVPAVSFLPYRLLIIGGKQVQVTDTAAIIADYEKRREYSLTAFDDKESGRLELFSTVQYNALQSVDWRFTPVTKVVTQTRKRVFDPFISAGWSTLGYVSVGAGVFYHNLGVEYRYLRGYNGGNDGHAVGMKWRF